MSNQQPNWVPANGGTEQETHVAGRRLLYVWNNNVRNSGGPSHGYLDLDTDMILSDDEVQAIFARVRGE